MAKILLFSDLHGHTHKAYAHYKEDSINSRLMQAGKILDDIRDAAKECDLALFAGDLYHVSPPPCVASNLLTEKMYAIAEECPIGMIVGNHDLAGKTYSHPLSVPFLTLRKNTEIFVFENSGPKDMVWEFGGQKIVGINFRRDEKEARRLIKENSPADILLIHQEIKGSAAENGWRFPRGISSKDVKGYKHVFSGHIHTPQKIGRIQLLGSLSHIRFGDSGERGYWILDTDTNESKMVPTSFPRFVSVVEGKDVKDDGNFYRVVTKKKKRERIELPRCEEAVADYVKKSKVPASYELSGRSLIAPVGSEELFAPSDFEMKQLYIRDFFSFYDVTLNFTNGVWLVAGLNGAGKSTLFEAICWCLYGQTSKGEKGSAVVRRGGKQAVVELKLVSPTRGTMIVTRTQDETSSSLTFNNAGGVPESGKIKKVQRELVALLGVDYEFFRQMIYFSQRSLDFFSSLGDAGKKSILGGLLGFRWYEVALGQAKIKRDKTKDLLEGAVEERKALAAKLEETESIVEELQKDAKEWDVKQKTILTELEGKEKCARAGVEVERNCLAVAVAKEQEHSDEIEVKIEHMTKKEGDAAEHCSKTEGLYTKYEDEIARLGEGIWNLTGVEGECTLCGSTLTKEQKTEHLHKLRSEQDALCPLMDEASEVSIKLGADCKKLKKDLDGLIFQKSVASRNANEIEKKLQRKLLGAETHLKVAEQQLKLQRRSIEEGTDNPYTKKVVELQEKIKTSEEDLLQDDIMLKSLRGKLKEFEFWVKGFGREGIPGLLLADFCGLFTEEANDVLSEIESSLRVELSPITKLKTGETRDRLYYMIKTPTGESSYNLLSGGEKTKVDLVSMLTLNRIASRQFNVINGIFGILIFDEVFSALDEDGSDMVLSVLNKFKSRSVYVVSHNAVLKSMFMNTIIVMKEHDVSNISQ